MGFPARSLTEFEPPESPAVYVQEDEFGTPEEYACKDPEVWFKWGQEFVYYYPTEKIFGLPITPAEHLLLHQAQLGKRYMSNGQTLNI